MGGELSNTETEHRLRLFAVGWYLLAMRPELRQYGAMRTKGTDPTNEEIAIEFGMGQRLGIALDRYAPVPALVRVFKGPDRPRQ